jgi:large subunit ribosomal protein L19
MSQDIIKHVEASQAKKDLPKLSVGDTVDVHVKIVEGAKERTQIFNGVIIAFRGQGLTRMVTVRRIVANEGVERVFPLHSPRVSAIEVKRHGHVRRSKLFYLRERVGKKRRLRDRRRGLGELVGPQEQPAQTTETAKIEATAAASA